MEQEKEDDPYDAIEFGDFGSYIRHKKQKLQLQQDELASLAPEEIPQIFEGIIVYVNGYTDPPIHELKTMIVQRGGEFRQYPSNLTQAKMKEFRNYKVAKPEWITESVKANRLLSWHKFSTLRVPTSFSKFGDSFNTQTPIGSFTSSSNVNDNSEPTSFSSKESLFSYKEPASTIHPKISMDEPDYAYKDKESVNQATDWADDDMFLDDLELDSFEFQPTPPFDNSGHTSALPTDNILEDDTDILTQPGPFINVGKFKALLPVLDRTVDGASSEVTVSNQPDNRHPTLIELSVPWNRLNSSIQPGFVEKFYQSSRLHYLSTWKLRLKELTTKMQKDKPSSLTKVQYRVIMHVDFDCFFASVATRNKPELRDKPIGVAHGSGSSTSNSEIASCNYLARKFGVKNGMQLLKARSLCSDLIVTPYEFQEYEDISLEFYKILLSYSDELQAVSVDEALLDVTSKCFFPWSKANSFSINQGYSTASSTMTPEELARRVREDIFAATGCHASVGVAPNILLAKLSTKRAKPHGQYIWPSAPGSDDTLKELQGHNPHQSEIEINLDMTPPVGDSSSQLDEVDHPIAEKEVEFKQFTVSDLPGVGYKTKIELQERFSAQTLQELQNISKMELQRICGMKTGEMLYNSCRGIDDTTFASDRDKSRQSVSAEISWGVRFENQQQVDVFMGDLAREVSKRLKEIDRKGKSVVIKVMKRKEYVAGHWKHLGHGPVDQFARTGQLPTYTDDSDLIAKEAGNLLRYFNFNVLDLRGLGIQVLKLNNDVVNSVPRSAFITQDSMNQTTLTSAMFQKKVISIAPVEPLGQPMIESVEDTNAGPDSEVFQGDVALEIDRETFKELPKDIQDELSRHHRFVYINQNDDVPTTFADEETVVSVNNSRSDSNGTTELQAERTIGGEGVLPTTRALVPWSQVNPADLAAMSTPMIRDTLNEYVDINRPLRAPSTANRVNEQQHFESGILPSPSKLDRSVLQELPPEIRAEIEQEYTHLMENQELINRLAGPNSVNFESSGNSPLQQPATLEGRARGKATGRGLSRGRPRGRGRGRGKGASNVNSNSDHSVATRDEYDGNFRESKESRADSNRHGHSNKSVTEKCLIPDLDSEFLAALPSDIRAEVEAAHRLEALKSRQKHAAQAALAKERLPTSHKEDHSKDVNTPERPTLMGFRQTADIKQMVGEWVQSTLLQTEENAGKESEESGSHLGKIMYYDEGPNPDDVNSFFDYIARVIFMERDLEKVRLVLKHLKRKTEENKRIAVMSEILPDRMDVVMSWSEALKKIMTLTDKLVVKLYGGNFMLD
ncbi:deoxycytidyl transferase [Entomortierella beljakovae]|nr:deoxycytidyl transferase [Entomortierella beljakovae]